MSEERSVSIAEVAAFVEALRQYEFNAQDCGDRPVIKLSADQAEQIFRDELKFGEEFSEITGRALELADLVASMIWGGSAGWERATDEQFDRLLDETRKRLRDREDGRKQDDEQELGTDESSDDSA